MQRQTRKPIVLLTVLGAGALLLAFPPVRRLFHPIFVKMKGECTVQDRLREFGDAARARYLPDFERAGAAYPSAHLVLLGLKDERRLEVYAGQHTQDLRFVKAYPVLGASGELGPKLREGDRQVPEGIYSIDSLNPNSRFHVSLRVGYPNDFDRRMAASDGRTNLGGDIFIHGGNASIGCLAMGDPAAEELFVMAAETGLENVVVLLAPVDLRLREASVVLYEGWRRELYAELRQRLGELPGWRADRQLEERKGD